MSPSRRLLTVALLALLALGQLPLASLAAAPVPLGAPTPANAEPGQLLIVFEPGTARAERDVAVGRRGGRTLREFDGINARLVALPSGKTTATATAELAAEPVVRYTQPNYIYRLDQAPNEPSGEFEKLWGLHNSGQTILSQPGTADADIDAPEAWEVTTGSPEVVVGVVDTGILYNHPDLAANMWTAPAGWNVKGCGAGTHGYRNSPGDPAGSACDPLDENSHGTHVAGTIGAVGNNDQGVVGVNWSVRLMALRFFNGSGQGNTAGAIDVIDYAIKAKQAGVNLRVLNNSWTGTVHDPALLAQIDAANAEGILFVAAAGNGGGDKQGDDNATSPIYPANYGVAPYNRANVIAVAATDNQDRLATFSNFGTTTVHLGAPGVGTYSTTLDNPNTSAEDYSYKSGTSMAAPHVAGAAALLLSVPGFGNLNPAELRARLMDCGDEKAALVGKTSSGKRLNIDRAIRGTDGCAPPPPPNPLPTIDTIAPASGLVGGEGFTLTVNGGNFVSTSVVRWNGTNRPTVYVSATQLTAAIPASLLATSGTAEITVFNPPPAGGTSAAVPFTIAQQGQAITFAALADKTYGDPSFAVDATASSGLAVSFAASSDCTIDASTVTLTGAGDCTITATQAGDGTYSAATAVTRTFAIAPAPTTVIVPPVIVPPGATDTTTTLTADVIAQVVANGGTVTFTVTGPNTPGTVTSGAVANGAATADFGLTGLAAGRYTIAASYTGTDDFAAGSGVGILSVGQTPQTISFAAPTERTYGDPAISLTATASSGLPVAFAVPAGDPCTLDGATLTITGVGECRVTASQVGDDTYAPAPNVTRTFTIAKATPIITWPRPAAITYGTPLGAAQLNATTDVAGTFAYQPIAGTVLGAGERQLGVTFTPDDQERYNVATATVILTVQKAAQSITLQPDPLPNRTLGGAPFVITASATSGLAVALSAGPSGVCTLSGTTITLVGAGVCTVTATQSGDANRLPAPTQTRTFQIAAPPSPSPSPSPSVAPTLYSFTLAQASGGTATANPGPGQYSPGTAITLTATPNADQLFTGWWVDGQLRSYASTATLILSGNRSVAPSFAARQTYGDVPPTSAAHEAITQLAARGIIRGYTPQGCAAQGRAYPCFGPNDGVTRAEMATLIARAMGWDAEQHDNPFTDRGGLDESLWRNVGTLAHYKVAFGYGNGKFGPNDKVTYAQTISFISRAMVVKGFWQARTVPPAPAPYGGILNGTGHQDDAATFLAYTEPAHGGVPDHPASGGFADWSNPSSRGWFARALWSALRSQYGAATIP